MTTHEEQDAKKSESYVAKLLQPLMTVLAAPIRAFYLAIGHADVTAFALMSFVVAGVGYLYVDLVRDINMPITYARVAREEAALRETELRIAEMETEQGISADSLTWTLGQMNWNAANATVSMQYQPLLGAATLIMGWKARTGGAGGLESELIFTNPSGSIVTTTFQFPSAWMPGDEVILDFTQELDTGKRVTWASSGRMQTVQ